ncbi:MAG TPA: TAXI family TRAP transporter solute-binding subunit [Vicinamibacterales bacterium]|nr:TAXI family TRAP transporter solute-binding subunit [Vicinamibacterales bacterium]
MRSRVPAIVFGAIVLFAIALAASGFDPREFSRKHGGTMRLSIATGNTGGVYYPYGGGLARVISQSVPHVDATAEVTAASVDNLKLIQLGKADIAFVLTDTLDDAIHGRGPFAKMPVKARTLAVLYPNYTQVGTIEGKGINRLADLRGRVVSTGSPGSGTEVIAFRVLRAAGIDPDSDIHKQSLTVNASVDALKDGKIDAFFWSGGLPTASLLDLASTVGATAKLIANDEVLPQLQQQYTPGLYFRLVIPKGTYPGVNYDSGSVGVANALVVKDTMTDELAYELTKVLFDRQPDLAAIHPEAKKLNVATAVAGSPAPFHPGAIRYYQERGAWKP